VTDEPRNLTSLQARIRNEARRAGRAANTVERLVANVVVGQMLPEGVMKGGAALQVRAGDTHTRASRDLDASRPAGRQLDDYLDDLEANLATGWHGFTGTVRDAPPPRAPEAVPPEYVMRPFRIALAYKGSAWVTIDFELGRDEVGSTAVPDYRIAKSVVDLLVTLGLASPGPIPLLPVDHQIAQKLHACTWVGDGRGNARAHPLVSLRVILREQNPYFAAPGGPQGGLYASPRAQSWKPVVVAYDGWESIYVAAAEGLDVLETVEQAIAWANEELIARM
jgi:hypothetical protein